MTSPFSAFEPFVHSDIHRVEQQEVEKIFYWYGADAKAEVVGIIIDDDRHGRKQTIHQEHREQADDGANREQN